MGIMRECDFTIDTSLRGVFCQQTPQRDKSWRDIYSRAESSIMLISWKDPNRVEFQPRIPRSSSWIFSRFFALLPLASICSHRARSFSPENPRTFPQKPLASFYFCLSLAGGHAGPLAAARRCFASPRPLGNATKDPGDIFRCQSEGDFLTSQCVHDDFTSLYLVNFRFFARVEVEKFSRVAAIKVFFSLPSPAPSCPWKWPKKLFTVWSELQSCPCLKFRWFFRR